MQGTALGDRTDAFIRMALPRALPLPRRWLLLPFRNSLLSGAQLDEAEAAARVRKAVWGLSALSILFAAGVVGNLNEGLWVFGLIAFMATLMFRATCGGFSRLGQRRRELVTALVPAAGFTHDRNAAGEGVFWTALAVAAYGVFDAFFQMTPACERHGAVTRFACGLTSSGQG